MQLLKRYGLPGGIGRPKRREFGEINKIQKKEGLCKRGKAGISFIMNPTRNFASFTPRWGNRYETPFVLAVYELNGIF